MTRNVAASVRARLANKARQTHRPFQELLQYYGLERFLYRFSRSRHREHFVLKGALMLRAWAAPGSRPTRDIDFLGFADNDLETLQKLVQEICVVDVVDDGLRFHPTTVTSERIKEGAKYEGVRLKFTGFLEKARIPMQIDVGFGDVVYPSVEEREYPTVLDFPAPLLRMYPRETVVAEKFEAMVFLGRLNSRMKDFFDIWLLARRFDFVAADLALAISRTFENRGTRLTDSPFALTSAFTNAPKTQKQWTAFVRRSKLEQAPTSFEELCALLRDFLLPITATIVENQALKGYWSAPGPWNTTQP